MRKHRKANDERRDRNNEMDRRHHDRNAKRREEVSRSFEDAKRYDPDDSGR